MGRWVTSKGRRIYIPDEGEENPYDKNSGAYKKKVSEVKEYMERTGKGLPKAVEHYHYMHPDEKGTPDKGDDVERQMWNLDDMTSPGSLANKFTDEERTEKVGAFLEDYEKNPEKYKGHEATVKRVKEWAAKHNTNGIRFNSTIAANETKKEKELAENKRQAENASGKKESFVVGNNPPTEKEQAAMNAKAIRISKHMPKEKQAELRRLKAEYQKQASGKKAAEREAKKATMKRSLVSLSDSTLKRMYKNASSDEEKKRIGAELNSRGYYGGITKKWKSIGGGR